ncbi:ATP-binding protein [Herbiconiux daphne]|uniref:ATP-binding protein n=1 Tax=Herbiconiux daphne TaxID=2970914 RepID=A0ABT2H1H6_9MICO|nr:ATP-binding protein [Herbiconiux daphne]MCS5733772.1 ATP-binding protein [Herbiconiux daphne]
MITNLPTMRRCIESHKSIRRLAPAEEPIFSSSNDAGGMGGILTDTKNLSVGLSAEFKLSGARTTYTLRAKVTGIGERGIQFLTSTGREITVPREAVVSISPGAELDAPRVQTGQGQRLPARTQGELARSVRRTLDGLAIEPQAAVRAKMLRLQLEDVLSEISSSVNKRRAAAVLKVAVAVEAQLAQHELTTSTALRKRAAEAVVEATTISQRPSRNILTTAIDDSLEALVAAHKDHWQMVTSTAIHPPVLSTRDRVNVTRGGDHEFDLPVRISLDRSATELSDVALVLDKYRNLALIGRPPMVETLVAGQTVTLTVRLRDNRKQGARGDINIDAHLRYRTPDGQTQTSPKQRLLLSIQGSEARSDIPNPYRRYAGGLPVSRPEMFFGRDALVHELVRDLGKTPGGTCYAVYGQQRTGKSSVLEQVKTRLLARKAVVAGLSMGVIDRRSVTIDFVEEILDQFRVQIDRLLPAETSRLLLARWPDTAAIESRPLRSFQRALEAGRSLLRSAGSTGVAFVVVVDEFTYVHEILRRRGIDPAEHNELKDFMRQLKGLLESRMFSALLIGQDTMPRFLESYPNEFSVMSTRKLDYLTVDEAQKLADLPIRTSEDSSRYTGYALSTIASYTGGHPFFTQILCDRVITLVNSHNRSEVTQSDVEEAVESLLSGRDRIEAHKFDCLVTADNTHTLITGVEGEDETDGIERSLTVLRRIANLSGSQNSPVAIDRLQLDSRQTSALDDLLLRGVLHHNESGVSIRVLLYADYLRRYQR